MPIKQKWCTSKGTSCDSYEQAEELERIEGLDTAQITIEEFILKCCDCDGFDISDFIHNFKTDQQQASDFVGAIKFLATQYHTNSGTVIMAKRRLLNREPTTRQLASKAVMSYGTIAHLNGLLSKGYKL